MVLYKQYISNIHRRWKIHQYNILQHHLVDWVPSTFYSLTLFKQSSSFNSVFTSIESQQWSHPKINSSRPWWTQYAAPRSWIQVWGSSLHVQSSQLQVFHHQSLWWGRVFKALILLFNNAALIFKWMWSAAYTTPTHQIAVMIHQYTTTILIQKWVIQPHYSQFIHMKICV